MQHASLFTPYNTTNPSVLSSPRLECLCLGSPRLALAQDDAYVYLVMERACCSLKQLIQHSTEAEFNQLMAFQVQSSASATSSE